MVFGFLTLQFKSSGSFHLVAAFFSISSEFSQFSPVDRESIWRSTQEDFMRLVEKWHMSILHMLY